MPIIAAHQLTKRFRRAVRPPGLVGALRHLILPHYDEKIAVDAIDFTIESGEMVAYVGPNGAGKSTTVKLLTGILVPSSGQVFVEGRIPHRQRIDNAQRIGAVFGQRTQLWWDLPVQESFRLLGDIYQIPSTTFRRTLTECVELLELAPLLHVQTRQLSLGQRMRCDLAAALLHAPPILFLDEPTIGLDVAVKTRVREFIRQIQRERGVTIILTSHDLSDIAKLCQRLIMIDNGKIVFDGLLETIIQLFGRERIGHFLLQENHPSIIDRARLALPELPHNAFHQPELHRLSVHFDASQMTAGVVISRLMAVMPVADVQIEEPTIESIIGQLYSGSLRFKGDSL